MACPISITCQAPAKINLYLRIVGKLDNGYHLIDSLFLPITLFDQLELCFNFDISRKVSCWCINQPELDGTDNLAARAAYAFFSEAGINAHLDIKIEKHIPISAGLGGGSSDAAMVLVFLNKIIEALNDTQLFSLAQSLGADVPFFLEPHPARVQGIGEKITPIQELPPFYILVANPKVPLPTQKVYDEFDRQYASHQEGSTLLSKSTPLENPRNLTWHDLPNVVNNDLQPAAEHLCPQIGELCQMIDAFNPLTTSMTGSGPTVFGIFKTEQACLQASKMLRASGKAIAHATQVLNP